MEDYYDIEDEAVIGTGALSVVKPGKRISDGKDFAVKIINKELLTKEQLVLVHDEIDIMNKIDNPHCIRMYECYESPQKVFMILELLAGGELFDRILSQSFFGEKMAAVVIRDVTSAIQHLHSHGIVHRDLKPENLIFQSKDENSPVKIADFGFGKINMHFYLESMTTRCGSPGYMAPEILKGVPYDNMCDLWSLGVVLYVLLCGFPPFFHDNQDELTAAILAGEYTMPSPYWDNISDLAKNLINGLLVVDPKKRMTADQVLNHPWILEGDAGGDNPSFSQKHRERIQTMLAKRRLRKTVKAIIALNKFKRNLYKTLGDREVLMKIEQDKRDAGPDIKHNSDDVEEVVVDNKRDKKKKLGDRKTKPGLGGRTKTNP